MSTAPSTDWTALTVEQPVDPVRRIIDAHHHLWEDGDGLHGASGYLHDDLIADMAGHNVVGTVYVEKGGGHSGKDGAAPSSSLDETTFAAAQAKRSAGSRAPILAIVAHADLTLGDAVQDMIDAHVEASDGLFRGIRQLPSATAHRRSGELLLLPEFRDGVAQLGRSGHSFDLLAIHTQLADVAALVAGVPETLFILNHLGMPLFTPGSAPREEVMAVWRRGMHLLARYPNVVVKIGGVGMDARFGTGWSIRPEPPGSDEVAAWWGDDIRWCIDSFGPSRCLFESNFPVDRQSFGYTILWNAFQKIASTYADNEQDALFSGTAQRVYRLKLPFAMDRP